MSTITVEFIYDVQGDLIQGIETPSENPAPMLFSYNYGRWRRGSHRKRAKTEGRRAAARKLVKTRERKTGHH